MDLAKLEVETKAKQKDQEIVIYSPYPITEELPHKKKIEFLNKKSKSSIR
mgnify:CR=1 FL=1